MYIKTRLFFPRVALVHCLVPGHRLGSPPEFWATMLGTEPQSFQSRKTFRVVGFLKKIDFKLRVDKTRVDSNAMPIVPRK